MAVEISLRGLVLPARNRRDYEKIPEGTCAALE
jgi:hypothetical protein